MSLGHTSLPSTDPAGLCFPAAAVTDLLPLNIPTHHLNTLKVRGPAWVSLAEVQGSARCIHSGGGPGENPFPAHPGR